MQRWIWTHTHFLHTHHSSLLFSVDYDFQPGYHGKGQRYDMRKEGLAPLPPVEWDLRQLEREPNNVLGNKNRKK